MKILKIAVEPYDINKLFNESKAKAITLLSQKDKMSTNFSQEIAWNLEINKRTLEDVVALDTDAKAIELVAKLKEYQKESDNNHAFSNLYSSVGFIQRLEKAIKGLRTLDSQRLETMSILNWCIKEQLPQLHNTNAMVKQSIKDLTNMLQKSKTLAEFENQFDKYKKDPVRSTIQWLFNEVDREFGIS